MSATTDPAAGRLSDAELAAWLGFLRAHAALIGALDAELIASHHLPLSSYDVLVQLERAPGRALRMRDLAAAVLLSRSGLTRLVDRLERDGLVQRVDCPTDRRSIYASLTDAGRARVDQLMPAHLQLLEEEFLAPLDATDRSDLERILRRLRDHVNPDAVRASTFDERDELEPA